MYSSGSTSIVVIVVVFITLATFVVGLRVRARGSVKSGLAADDYVIAVALVRLFTVPSGRRMLIVSYPSSHTGRRLR